MRAEAGPGWRGHDEGAPIDVAVDRLLAALDERARAARRTELVMLLTDLRDGTCSALELDGEMFHARNHQRGTDLDRDLDLVAEQRVSVRLGWAQVFDRPCRTAGKVARVLANRGWCGTPSECGPGCTVAKDWAA